MTIKMIHQILLLHLSLNNIAILIIINYINYISNFLKNTYELLNLIID